MAKVFTYITINYEKDIYTPSIDMMQGDTGRGLIFNIASPIDGLESELSNLTATLNIVKPTGETQTVTGTIESLGNDMAKITIEPSSDLASAIDVSGLANATLVIANTTQTVTSFNFKIKIKPNPFYPKPTVRKFDVTKVSRITGVQQYEHCVQSIEFVGLDYTGNMYIVLNNDTFVQDSETEGYHNTVPLTNNTFIIGQPMTFYSGVFSCQLLGETTSNGETTKFEISPIFYIEVAESIEQGEETEYPIDPNITFGIDTYIADVKEQAKSEIEATGEAVKNSIPSDYSTLEQATYNAYPTESESGNPIYIDDGAKDIPVKELIVNLEPKQEGSGEPSPSNVRQISGYDVVTVKRTGKNLLKNIAQSGTVANIQYVVKSDGTIVGNGTSNSWNALLIGRQTMPKGTYKASTGFVSNDIYLGISYQGNIVETRTLEEVEFTLTDTAEVVVNLYARPMHAVLNNLVIYPMIRVAGSTSYYSKYNGTSYSITFPSSVGTVYGGTLNVTTGVLTVDRAFGELDGSESLSWAFSNTSVLQTAYTSLRTLFPLIKKSGIDSVAKFNEFKAIYSTSNRHINEAYIEGGYINLIFSPSTFADVNAVKTWLSNNPLQIVYELATHTTVQLTPTEVTTLIQGNTFMSDGEINLTYRQDTNTVIDRLTNAIISLGGNV